MPQSTFFHNIPGMDLTVLYEDNHIIAVNKPAGMLTQGDISGDRSLLDFVREYIRIRYNKPGNVFTGLVHRLDKPVSGVVVFAKTSKAARRLHSEFLNRRVKKIYIALTREAVTTETGKWHLLEQNIARKRGHSVIVSGNEGQRAGLRYTVLESAQGHSLVLVDLLTGRKHQIRAQLSSIGLPVLGDTLYGSKSAPVKGSICLHACYISLSHPVRKEPLEIYAEIPGYISEKTGISDKEIIDCIKNMPL